MNNETSDLIYCKI